MDVVAKQRVGQFIRLSIGRVNELEAVLPRVGRFRALKGERRWLESAAPNWHQLPPPFFAECLHSSEADAAANALSRSISGGAQDLAVRLGRNSFTLSDERDLLRTMLIAYLWVAGARRWRHRAFDRVWSFWTTLLDPGRDSLPAAIVAPVFGMGRRFKRRLRLDNDWSLRSESPSRAAEYANAEPILAGHLEHGYTRRWTTQFLVQRTRVSKEVFREPQRRLSRLDEPVGLHTLDRELVLLRALFHEAISIPRVSVLLWPDWDLYNLDLGFARETPWRPRLTTESPSIEQIRTFRRTRLRFMDLQHADEWWGVFATMRRFSASWENPFPADRLADIVAALEGLVLAKETSEVGYKLRVRISNLICKTTAERKEVMKDISTAYGYRSTVAHGGYVLDNLADWREYERVTRKKKENPFKDSNEIRRLTGKITLYYRKALFELIRLRLRPDWAARGL